MRNLRWHLTEFVHHRMRPNELHGNNPSAQSRRRPSSLRDAARVEELVQVYEVRRRGVYNLQLAVFPVFT